MQFYSTMLLTREPKFYLKISIKTECSDRNFQIRISSPRFSFVQQLISKASRKKNKFVVKSLQRFWSNTFESSPSHAESESRLKFTLKNFLHPLKPIFQVSDEVYKSNNRFCSNHIIPG